MSAAKEESAHLAVVVLAAGQGTRMRSAHAKVLHPLGGRELVPHEGEERRDQERGTEALLAEELGGDEVDRALAPAGSLDD